MIRESGDEVNTFSFHIDLFDWPPFGWRMGHQNGGAFSQLSAVLGTPTANTWIRVGTAMYDVAGMVSFLNGAQVTSAGVFNASSGNVGLQKWTVPAGGA